MRKALFIVTVAFILGFALFSLEGRAQMDPETMGPHDYGDWKYCPYCGAPLGPGGRCGMGPGTMGPGYGRGYGMRHPGRRMGPGTMGPERRMGPGMMGPGMMHPEWGWGRDPGMGPGYGPGYGPQYGPRYQRPQEPLEKKEAKEMLENYLQSTRNPNLKLGAMEDKGSYFEAEILTKEDSLVDKIAVNKETGRMRSIY
ncbi:MAG: hypothetical protein ACOC6E_02395 [Thermodesulfobacteriota bacterium]